MYSTNYTSKCNSSARCIPTNTFDAFLPRHKLSTWQREDEMIREKRKREVVKRMIKGRPGGKVEGLVRRVTVGRR